MLRFLVRRSRQVLRTAATTSRSATTAWLLLCTGEGLLPRLAVICFVLTCRCRYDSCTDNLRLLPRRRQVRFGTGLGIVQRFISAYHRGATLLVERCFCQQVINRAHATVGYVNSVCSGFGACASIIVERMYSDLSFFTGYPQLARSPPDGIHALEDETGLLLVTSSK